MTRCLDEFEGTECELSVLLHQFRAARPAMLKRAAASAADHLLLLGDSSLAKL
jgi:hypothetical protein